MGRAERISLDEIARRSPGNPYRRLADVLPADEQAELFLDDLTRMHADCNDHAEVAGCFTCLRRLDFDSNLLSIAVAKLDVYGPDAAAAGRFEAVESYKGHLADSGHCFLNSRVVADDRGALELLGALGFHEADTLVNMRVAAEELRTGPRAPGIRILAAKADDEAFFRRVAELNYENRLSREDALDQERVRRLFGEWAANNLKGRMSMNLVALAGEHPVGFISGRLTPSRWRGLGAVGLIDLVVVDEAARGRGIGRMLTQAGTETLLRDGAMAVELNVAGRNEPAMSLYRNTGFREWLRFIDFTLWLDQ